MLCLIFFIIISYLPACVSDTTCISSANAQSLVQLAAALNAGYFAFQAANSAHYEHIHTALTDLDTYYRSIRTSNDRVRHCGAQILDYKRRCNSRRLFYERFNRIAIYVGYSNFMFMCFCLLYLTVSKDVPNWTIFPIYFVGYSPLAVVAIIEILFRSCL